jgi:HlyD family secretion protein
MKISFAQRTAASSRTGMARKKMLIVIGSSVAVLLVLWLIMRGGGTSEFDVDLETAARSHVTEGNMTISVLQAGELKPKKTKKIINETGRNAKIISIVDDGALVKKGDLLIELNSDDTKTQLLTDQSDVSNAQADLRKSEQDMAINTVQNNTDLASAKLAVSLAEIDLHRYEQGEFPQNVRSTEMDIQLSKQELTQAEDKLRWAEELLKKGYTSRQDYESKRLTVETCKTNLKKNQETLRILKEFTFKKDLMEKKNTVAKAKAEVIRLQHTYESQHSTDEAAISSKKTTLSITRDRLKRTQSDLAKCDVVSDSDGQVFYTKSEHRWENRSIEVGSSVDPQQAILEFPNLSSWMVETAAPESIIEKIKEGQKAVIAVDAMPGVFLNGVVDKVKSVPQAGEWFDSSTKKYPVTLDIPTTPTITLKPGLSVKAEIIMQELKNVLMVPIQALRTEGEQHFIYVIKGSRIKKTPVVIGESNDTNVQILSGAQKGQDILLYAPVSANTRGETEARPDGQAGGPQEGKGGPPQGNGDKPKGNGEKKPEGGEKGQGPAEGGKPPEGAPQGAAPQGGAPQGGGGAAPQGGGTGASGGGPR